MLTDVENSFVLDAEISFVLDVEYSFDLDEFCRLIDCLLSECFRSRLDLLGVCPVARAALKLICSQSLYKGASLSESESFLCLEVPELLRNGEPQRSEILRDDSPLDKDCFRLKNIRIRRTVS